MTCGRGHVVAPGLAAKSMVCRGQGGGPALYMDRGLLKVYGQEVARTTVQRTVPAGFPARESIDVGVCLDPTVSVDYMERWPFRFDGRILEVAVKFN